jgi:mRNA interferase MazF
MEFPFTNMKEHKQRPAVVVKDTKDNDAVFVRITTKERPEQFELKIQNWEKAGLLKPSVIRIHKIASLQTDLIVKQMGKLSKQDKLEFRNALKIFFENNE